MTFSLTIDMVLIALAVLERILFVKRNDIWYRMKQFIEILFSFLLFLISFFITDSAAGTLYVFLGMINFIRF